MTVHGVHNIKKDCFTFIFWLCNSFANLHSMQQGPSWEANNSSAGQEIYRIWFKPKVHYPIHKRPALKPLTGPLTNSMEQSPTSDTNISSWNPKIHYHNQYIPPPVRILRDRWRALVNKPASNSNRPRGGNLYIEANSMAVWVPCAAVSGRHSGWWVGKWVNAGQARDSLNHISPLVLLC